MAKEVKITTDLLTEVVDFVEGSGQLMAQREKQAASVEAQAKITLDVLQDKGLAPKVGAADSKLLTKLADPVEALKALAKTADLVGMPKLGGADKTEKAASSKGISAEEKFEAALGL